MKKILACLCAWVLFNPAFCAACGDNPRLPELPEILAKGEALPGRIYLNGATFLRLRPDIRKQLTSQIVICPEIPLNSKGLPMTRLRLPFTEIWEALEWAVNAGDWEQANFIVNSVQALPLPAEALVSLLALPVWNQQTMEKLAGILGIAPNVSKWRFFLLDVYQALGGRAENPQPVAWSSDENERANLRTRADALNTEVIITPYSGRYAKEAAASLARVGIEFIPVRKFGK